jgi:hypothetical protein
MGFWSTVGRVTGITPLAELATKGKLSDDSKDFYTFGGATRERRANEREQAAASAADAHKQALNTGYQDYRKQLEDQQNIYGKTQSGIDTQSKDSMSGYRTLRETMDRQADSTRQDLMGMESNMLDTTVNNMKGITDTYVNKANALDQQAQQQATDAQTTYTNTIKPNLMNNLSDAQNFQQTVSSQAMSLADAMDANNKVATQQRQLYGDLADQMTGRFQTMSDEERADLEALMQRGVSGFGGEIEGTRKRGLADAGVLAALGAQATNLLGGGANPMTGSQMAALQAQQGAQSSEAYAAAQRRMQGLEDQRRAYQLSSLATMGDRASDLRRGSLAQEGALRSRGIEAGREESGAMYDRGYRATTEAMDRTSRRLADLMGGESSQNELLARLRGERSGYAQDTFGATGDQEKYRASADDRKLSSKMGFEEGKIQRGYGNAGEDLKLREAGFAIDRAAADRGFGFGQNLAGLDYQNTSEQAGLAQSAVANQIQMGSARDQGNLAALMGLLQMGTQVGSTYAGRPQPKAG